MKTTLLFAVTILLASIALPAAAQKYKTPADTPRLNKEYVKLSNEIAELTSKVTIAQNNLPGYFAKASDAASEAEETAENSSKQADKATNGTLADAKKAKKKAKRAYKDAQDASQADHNIKKHEKKIESLNAQLVKKQQKLAELDLMRTAIRMQEAQ